MIPASNCNRAAELLGAAANLLSVEFYAEQSEVNYGKPTELRCRIYGLHPMTKQTITELSEELNSAIRPVLEAYAQNLQKIAASHLFETL